MIPPVTAVKQNQGDDIVAQAKSTVREARVRLVVARFVKIAGLWS
jgi:hypothetical protein